MWSQSAIWQSSKSRLISSYFIPWNDNQTFPSKIVGNLHQINLFLAFFPHLLLILAEKKSGVSGSRWFTNENVNTVNTSTPMYFYITFTHLCDPMWSYVILCDPMWPYVILCDPMSILSISFYHRNTHWKQRISPTNPAEFSVMFSRRISLSRTIQSTARRGAWLTP